MKIIILHITILVFLVSGFSFSQKSYSDYYTKGINALEAGDTATAEKFFELGVRDLNDVDCMFELSKLCIEINSVKSRVKARRLLEKAVLKKPYRTDYKFLLAEVYENFSKNMAYDVYQSVLKTDPSNKQAVFNLGRLKEEDFYEYYNSFVKEDFTPALSLEEFAFDDFLLAENYFKKLIELDSTFTDAHIHLSALYETIGLYDESISLLQYVTEIEPGNKEARLHLAMVQYKAGKIDSSLQSYNKAFALMSEKEKAEFFEKTTEMIFKEIMDDDTTGFDSEDITALWNERDPLLLTDYNERLLEHYSRVAYSNLKFGVDKKEMAGWESDRGEIFIRYGEPLQWMRLRPYVSAGGNADVRVKTDIWLYENKILGFADEYWNGEFRLSAPNYSGKLHSQFPGDSHSYAEYLRRTSPEEYTPKFEGPLFDIPFDIYQFKSLDKKRADETEIFLGYLFSLPDSVVLSNNETLSHQYGLFLLNKKNQSVKELRERDFTEEIIERKNVISLNSKPDSLTLAFELIRDFDKGVSTNRKPVVIKDFSTDDLMMSDIVMANSITENRRFENQLLRKNISIEPNASNRFYRKDKIHIYYELYNINKNENDDYKFEQSIKVEKIVDESGIGSVFNSLLKTIGLKDEKRELLITNNYQSADSFSQVYFQIDMNDYEPGNYKITVSVNDESNSEIVSQEKIFRLDDQ